MSAHVRWQRCWDIADRLLLGLVIFLLVGSWVDAARGLRHSPCRQQCHPRTNGEVQQEVDDAPEAMSEESQPQVRAIEGTPVALRRSQVSHLARQLAASKWDSLPASPAADMREGDGYYEILFALPQRFDPASVSVSTSGNVLSLFVRIANQPTAAFVKQFYIPCGTGRAGPAETSVSNEIVRIRIPQHRE